MNFGNRCYKAVGDRKRVVFRLSTNKDTGVDSSGSIVKRQDGIDETREKSTHILL